MKMRLSLGLLLLALILCVLTVGCQQKCPCPEPCPCKPKCPCPKDGCPVTGRDCPCNGTADAPKGCRCSDGKKCDCPDRCRCYPCPGRDRTAAAEQAPELDVGDWVNSKGFSLADCKGKVVVLDFWATWCGPCREALPHVGAVVEKYSRQGVVVVSVHVKNGGDKMPDFVKEKGYGWPFCVDKGSTAKAYHARFIPRLIVIGKDGSVLKEDVDPSGLDKAVGKALEAR